MKKLATMSFSFVAITVSLCAHGHHSNQGQIPKFLPIMTESIGEPVYAIDAGDFDTEHPGSEIALLSESASVYELFLGAKKLQKTQIVKGEFGVADMEYRPTIGIGDVVPHHPGNEIVFHQRPPSIVNVLYSDESNDGWIKEEVINMSDYIGNGWGARVGDYDPYRPGDEIFFIWEGLFDFSTGHLFSATEEEWNSSEFGNWDMKIVYGGKEKGEVGMDSAVGNFNWMTSGSEIVIGTEMGPTYEIKAEKSNGEMLQDWNRTTLWDDFDQAAWVVKSADIDKNNPGDEIIYGTRYSNEIIVSYYTPEGEHMKETIFKGRATDEDRTNIWDIAVGDVLTDVPGLEIVAVDDSGYVYLIANIDGEWVGKTIFKEMDSLYAVTVEELIPNFLGDEIVVTGESGLVRLLTSLRF